MGICLQQDADLHMVQLMSLPPTSLAPAKSRMVLPFLVPAHLGSPGQRAVKWVCVCVVETSHTKQVGDFIETQHI